MLPTRGACRRHSRYIPFKLLSRVSALHCAIKRLWRQAAREATCDQQTCHKTRITCDRKLWRPAMRSCTTCPILTQSTSPPRVLISTNSLRSTQQDGSARPRPCFTYTRMRRLIHASVSDTRLFECAGPKLRGRMLCCMHARYAARTQPSPARTLPFTQHPARQNSAATGVHRDTQRHTGVATATFGVRLRQRLGGMSGMLNAVPVGMDLDALQLASKSCRNLSNSEYRL